MLSLVQYSDNIFFLPRKSFFILREKKTKIVVFGQIHNSN